MGFALDMPGEFSLPLAEMLYYQLTTTENPDNALNIKLLYSNYNTAISPDRI